MTSGPAGVEVADGVFRLGTRYVNFYAVHDETGVTLVDAGLPDHLRQLRAHLARLGRTAGDVRAVLVTHGHADHLGCATGLGVGVPVWVSGPDADLALGRRHSQPEATLRSAWWHPFLARFFLDLVRGGITRVQLPTGVRAFDDGAVLDVPGRPVAVAVPGHTPGSAAFWLPERGVLFTGDALVTVDCVTGRRGAQVMHRLFSDDTRGARACLPALAVTGAATLLPGHGEPWTQGAALAVAHAQA